MEFGGGPSYGINTLTATENITDPTTTIGKATCETKFQSNAIDFIRAIDIMISVSAPIVLIVGLVGNSLTLVVMMFGPSFRKINMGVYCSALALVDTVCLCVQRLNRDWFEWKFNILLDVISVAGCKTLMFTHYFSSCCGSWLIVAVTLERLFVVCFPFKAKVVCTRRSTFIVVIIIVLVTMLANVYTLFLFDIYPCTNGFLYCKAAKGYRIASTVVDFALYSFLPSVVLWIANVILIVKLYTRDHDSLTQEQSSSTLRTSLMLLTVSFTFLLLTTPISLYLVIRALADIQFKPYMIILQQVLETLSSMNPAINFFLYCLSGPMFRRDLAMVFVRCCCVCRQKPPGSDDDDRQLPSFRRMLVSLCNQGHCVCRRETPGSSDDDGNSTRSSCLPCHSKSSTEQGIGSRQQIYRLDSIQSLQSTPPLNATYVTTGAVLQYGDPYFDL